MDDLYSIKQIEMPESLLVETVTKMKETNPGDLDTMEVYNEIMDAIESKEAFSFVAEIAVDEKMLIQCVPLLEDELDDMWLVEVRQHNFNKN